MLTQYRNHRQFYLNTVEVIHSTLFSDLLLSSQNNGVVYVTAQPAVTGIQSIAVVLLSYINDVL